jgi:hypothetical protein
MSRHQKAVVDNTDQFMKAFTSRKGLDWKMGLVSTAVEETPFLGFTTSDQLNAKTPNPVRVFQTAVKRLGLVKGCPELVFEPVIQSLTKYKNFVRKDSMLAILALTDTMEEKAGMQASFEKFLRGLKGNLKKVRFYGTFAGQSFTCSSGEPPWTYPGSPFEYFIKLTKGTVFDLCKPDFGKNLAKVGEDMARSVTHSRISLERRPEVESLRVTYLGKELPGGSPETGGMWAYNFSLNSIEFHNLEFSQNEEDSIEVSYETPKAN